MTTWLQDYPWLSVIPPLIAIGLAIATRRVLLSLGAAIVVGASLLASDGLVGGGQKSAGWWDRFWQSLWYDHLYTALDDWDHQRVFIFSLTLGAMVGVIEAAGGMEELVRRLRRLVKTRCGGQGLVWGLGLGVFFDDYANTLLLGTTMRSTADRLKISRAKLAYLVDSTAAPVAGLAVVSTWVATEISLIGDGLEVAGVAEGVTPFVVFLESIGYRFYAILALVMVAVIAWSGRDFGPMLTEERRSLGTLPVSLAGARLGEESTEAVDIRTGVPKWVWLSAIVPVLVCVAVVFVYLVIDGRRAVGESTLTGVRYWGEVLGKASSYDALLWGSLAGLATALWLGAGAMVEESATWAPETSGWGPVADCAMGIYGLLAGMVQGAIHILPAMAILWLAWSLSSMTADDFLGTGQYLGDKLAASRMPVWCLPTAVFVTSGFVALSTGTSWGTMTILTPLSVQLALTAGTSSVGQEQAIATGGPLLIATVGAVLAGSIFGDHCSPISDTTVLSSRASGCNHILHVRTQMPYALFVGGVSIVLGTVPSGLGAPAWLCLLLSSAVIVGGVYWIGQRADRFGEVNT